MDRFDEIEKLWIAGKIDACETDGMPYQRPKGNPMSWLMGYVKGLRSNIDRLRFFNEGIGKELDELRAEVERLRKIEDAAIDWESPAVNSSDQARSEIRLSQALRANPRPESADG